MSYSREATRAAAAQRVPKPRFGQDPAEGAAQGDGVAGRDEKARGAVGQDLGASVHGRSDDGPACGHGFEERERGAFVERGHADHVDGPEQLANVGAVSREHHPVADAQGLGLLPQGLGEIPVAHDQEPGLGMPGENGGGGFEQVAVALLLVEAADGADHERGLRNAERGTSLRGHVLGYRSELGEGSAVPDDADPFRGHPSLAHQEIAGGAADRDGAVGETREQPVGEALIGGHARIGEVLVQDEGGARRARREPPEVRRGVAMHVEDLRSAGANQGYEVGEDPRVESAPAQVSDGNTLLFEQAGGGLPGLETDERNREPRRVEAGEPPREEPGDPVDARAGHPELVADVDNAHWRAQAPGLSADEVRREVQTTAPDKDKSTIRPAPTRLKARALSRDRPIWPK